MLAEKSSQIPGLHPLFSENEGTLLFQRLSQLHFYLILVKTIEKNFRFLNWKPRGLEGWRTDFSSPAGPRSASLLCPCCHQLQLQVRAPQDRKSALVVPNPLLPELKEDSFSKPKENVSHAFLV